MTRAKGPGKWWSIHEPGLPLGEGILVPDLAGWRRRRLAVRNPWFNRSLPLRRVHQTRFKQDTPTACDVRKRRETDAHATDQVSLK